MLFSDFVRFYRISLKKQPLGIIKRLIFSIRLSRLPCDNIISFIHFLGFQIFGPKKKRNNRIYIFKESLSIHFCQKPLETGTSFKILQLVVTRSLKLITDDEWCARVSKVNMLRMIMYTANIYNHGIINFEKVKKIRLYLFDYCIEKMHMLLSFMLKS